MRIPSHRQELLRKHEKNLFFTEDIPKHERIYGFYLLIRPLLDWFKEELISKGLEQDEAESETYLCAAKIYGKFDTSRSSIIPYLEKAIPWYTAKALRRFEKTKEPYITDDIQQISINEEFYWDPIKILFEERYIGKCFTRAEKWAITKVLNEEKISSIERKTFYKYLSDIKEVLTKWRNS